mmetsp:Transcript_20020/g.17691  ORF Transcript_20020/g.17691 Transcript_20020/m.17691 type:complete len:167 (-) Transcript_20020:63-563(-)
MKKEYKMKLLQGSYNEGSEEDTIYFYGTKTRYGEFSNFYRSLITIDGIAYETSEHYFQCMKFYPSDEHMELVRLAKSPGIAARLGRSRKNPLRKDWEEVKDDLMYQAIYAKFTQNEELKQILQETGDKYLVEHTKKDFYWADGGTGEGKNMLGIQLMKLRDELKKL